MFSFCVKKKNIKQQFFKRFQFDGMLLSINFNLYLSVQQRKTQIDIMNVDRREGERVSKQTRETENEWVSKWEIEMSETYKLNASLGACSSISLPHPKINIFFSLASTLTPLPAHSHPLLYTLIDTTVIPNMLPVTFQIHIRKRCSDEMILPNVCSFFYMLKRVWKKNYSCIKMASRTTTNSSYRKQKMSKIKINMENMEYACTFDRPPKNVRFANTIWWRADVCASDNGNLTPSDIDPDRLVIERNMFEGDNHEIPAHNTTWMPTTTKKQ